jgi:hypothetical protein
MLWRPNESTLDMQLSHVTNMLASNRFDKCLHDAIGTGSEKSKNGGIVLHCRQDLWEEKHA